MTTKAWWASVSSCAMVSSTVDACPVCVLFSNFVKWVRSLVRLAGGASAACVWDLVLCAGAVVWNLVLCFLVLCLQFVFVDCSALETDGVDNWGTWVFGCVVYLVCRVLFLVCSGTPELAGAHVVVVGVVAIDVFVATRALWSESDGTFLRIRCYFPIFYCFGAVLYFCHHFFSMCDGGSGEFLWLNCIVYVKRSLLVDLIWHLCVR